MPARAGVAAGRAVAVRPELRLAAVDRQAVAVGIAGDAGGDSALVARIARRNGVGKRAYAAASSASVIPAFLPCAVRRERAVTCVAAAVAAGLSDTYAGSARAVFGARYLAGSPAAAHDIHARREAGITHQLQVA
jgi:hypothetical protein